MFFLVMTFCLFNSSLSCITTERIEITSTQSDDTELFSVASHEANEWLKLHDNYFLYRVVISDQDNALKFEWKAPKTAPKVATPPSH